MGLCFLQSVNISMNLGCFQTLATKNAIVMATGVLVDTPNFFSPQDKFQEVKFLDSRLLSSRRPTSLCTSTHNVSLTIK